MAGLTREMSATIAFVSGSLAALGPAYSAVARLLEGRPAMREVAVEIDLMGVRADVVRLTVRIHGGHQPQVDARGGIDCDSGSSTTSTPAASSPWMHPITNTTWPPRWPRSMASIGRPSTERPSSMRCRTAGAVVVVVVVVPRCEPSSPWSSTFRDRGRRSSRGRGHRVRRLRRAAVRAGTGGHQRGRGDGGRDPSQPRHRLLTRIVMNATVFTMA